MSTLKSCLGGGVVLLPGAGPGPGHGVPGDGGHDLPGAGDAEEQLTGGLTELPLLHPLLQPGGEASQGVVPLLHLERWRGSKSERECVDSPHLPLRSDGAPLPLKWESVNLSNLLFNFSSKTIPNSLVKALREILLVKDNWYLWSS